ncbi:hypothetical protein Pmani_010219 [Petrolisthes manimaculis]|uniref:Uncharacterized protein n=1 Tax=Petrolisthes manimaculis TaxID=1843537 RepID=A0AAE1Q2G2_9EUCA|nr:hypothetical protein Pmani_010219 [Petrolisthes manimaculis]
MYLPYITHAFSNISGISQLDISVTRNERVDRRGRKRAVDVMLYDSSSNIELDQGNTTTEKTNDPVERHNAGGDTAIDNVQGNRVPLKVFCSGLVHQILERYGTPTSGLRGRALSRPNLPDRLGGRDYIARHYLMPIPPPEKQEGNEEEKEEGTEAVYSVCSFRNS